MSDSIITVSNSQIILLLADAQGFKRAVLQLKISIFDSKTWKQSGDCLSPLAVTGMFAIELFLKLLRVIDTFDPTLCQGQHLKTHDVKHLFDNLDDSTQNELSKRFDSGKYTNGQSLINFLELTSTYFLDWRYAYTSNALSFNLNTMWDIICLLDDYSNDKYLAISNVLASNGLSALPDQFISISNPDDIRDELS